MLKLAMYPIKNKSNNIYNHKNVKNKNTYFTGLCQCLLTFLLWIFMNSAVVAAANLLSPQDKEPLNIQSDSANFDDKKGLATHVGHVSVDQGDRLLSADSLEIHRNKEGKVDFITAKGNPASFEANPDPNKPKIYGKANLLKYFPNENKIILMDSAELKQEDKTLQGALITYHFDTQTLTSDAKENQRTTIILKNKETE